MEIQIYNPTIKYFDTFDNELKIGDRVLLSQNNRFFKARVEYFTENGRVAVYGCFTGCYPQLLFKLSDKLVRI